MLVFSEQTFANLWFGVILWYGFGLYGRLKFNEINNKIEKLMNNYTENRFTNILLLYILKEHNYIERGAKDFNHYFRCITFIIYYLATPGFLISFIRNLN